MTTTKKRAAPRQKSPKRARSRTRPSAAATERASTPKPDADGRIYLPDGRWYRPSDIVQEDGRTITSPDDPEMDIWEVGPDGRDVTWKSQAWLSSALGVSTRWIMQLEKKGLPVRGFRNDCEYPVPHCIVWYEEYQRRLIREKTVTHVSIAEAWAEHDYRCAIEEAEIERRMARDPLYRAMMEASDAGDDDRADELMHRLWDRDGWPTGARHRHAS